MKFKVKASDFTNAISIVGIVTPRPILPTSDRTGYLMVVRDGTCYLYSRDATHVARASFPATDVDENGMCIFPAEHAGQIKYLGDSEIAFDVSSDGDTHMVKFDGGGSECEYSSFDPKLMASCDSDLASATEGKSFPATLLREALSSAGSFAVDAKKADSAGKPEAYSVAQVFDKSNPEWEKGSGTMYATNRVYACYFYCEAFEDKGLAVHSQHFGVVQNFLGKSSGNVEIRTGSNMTFAVNSDGQVLGWVHTTSGHTKYSFYALTKDQYVLHLPKAVLVNALRYTKSGLPSPAAKTRITYSHKERSISFSFSESIGKGKSFPVPIIKVEKTEERDWSFGVNLDHLLMLVSDVKGNEVNFHVCTIEPGGDRKNESAMFRTVDEYWVDSDAKLLGGVALNEDGTEKRPEGGTKCRVIRFVGSKA